MVAEVCENGISVGDEDSIRRVGRLVHESEGALDDPKMPDLDEEVGSIGRRLGGLPRLGHPRTFRARRLGGMNVIDADSFNGRFLELDGTHLGSVFKFSGSRQSPLVHRDVVAIGDRLEIVELDVLQHGLTLERRIRLGQEVRTTVDPDVSRVERRGLQLKLRWVDPVL